MPPTLFIPSARVSRVRSLRRSRLARSTLYALLFLLLACLGDRLHGPEQPYGRLAVTSSEAPLPEGSPEGNPDGEILGAPESPDRCFGFRGVTVALPQSSAHVPPPAVTTSPPTDTTDSSSTELADAARRLPQSGGRSALAALCRWRI
ncbi:hypothetical protein OG241_18000 [Streptomyces sp. NBC_01390]|uniref:hypothetical protein n=1 Tax=Streptomyces sp. NBC_01390 TaxID=2903850 RepID=UPI00324EE53D